MPEAVARWILLSQRRRQCRGPLPPHQPQEPLHLIPRRRPARHQPHQILVWPERLLRRLGRPLIQRAARRPHPRDRRLGQLSRTPRSPRFPSPAAPGRCRAIRPAAARPAHWRAPPSAASCRRSDTPRTAPPRTATSMNVCPARCRRAAMCFSLSGENTTIASAAQQPFLVPPNDRKSTPAFHVSSAGFAPVAATALPNRAPSMCTASPRARAIPASVRTSSRPYTVPRVRSRW